MSKKEMDAYLLGLLIRNAEIDVFEDAIRELLASCATGDEIEVLKHVLEHVLVIHSDRLARPMNALAEIIGEEVVEHGPTAVVAMAYDSSPDSSQTLIQLLKPLMLGQKDIVMLNTVPSYLKKNTAIDYPNCVLIDEFSGTGGTIKNRIDYIKKDHLSRGRSGQIKAKVLFGMSAAKRFLNENGYETDFLQTLKAGISGYFSGVDRDRLISAMKSIEAQLAPEFLGKPIPSLGHGEAEAMFNIKGWNAPNSNFPIFWWPETAAGERRNTMMVRNEL